MSNKITLRVAKTVIKDIEIDLDEYYSYSEMNKKDQHNQIQSILNDYGDIFDEQKEDRYNDDVDFDLMSWELD